MGRVTVILERRSDGGLRVYSDQALGLILSNPDPIVVGQDIVPALLALGHLEVPANDDAPSEATLDSVVPGA